MKLEREKFQKLSLRLFEKMDWQCELCAASDDVPLVADPGFFDHPSKPARHVPGLSTCLCESCHEETQLLRKQLIAHLLTVHPIHLHKVRDDLMSIDGGLDPYNSVVHKVLHTTGRVYPETWLNYWLEQAELLNERVPAEVLNRPGMPRGLQHFFDEVFYEGRDERIVGDIGPCFEFSSDDHKVTVDVMLGMLSGFIADLGKLGFGEQEAAEMGVDACGDSIVTLIQTGGDLYRFEAYFKTLHSLLDPQCRADSLGSYEKALLTTLSGFEKARSK